MTLEFNEDGLSIDTFDEIRQALADAYRDIYGQDINLDPDTQDGQRVGIESKERLDMQSLALFIYNQMDPDLAAGRGLDKIIKLAGITRGTPARSSVDVTVTADYELTLPDGFTVEDDTNRLWRLDGSRDLTAGANTVTLSAVAFGAVEAPAGTVTSPATVVLGVESVTNPAAAVVGRDEESDADLRSRRRLSVQNPATSTSGGLYSALGNLTGVQDLQVYENDTNVEDTDLDLGPHSLWCVVRGGEVAEIIETIAKNKTGGTPLKGDVTGAYNEQRERPDGTTFTVIHEMRFDRPVEVPLHVSLTVESTDGSAVDEVSIKERIAARSYHIAEQARASNLYSRAYGAVDNIVATDMQISDDGSTYTDGRIESAPDAFFSINFDDIDLTVI